VRTPLNSCEALAEQIKRLTVSLFTVIDIEKLEALARKHVYCWLWLWAGLRGLQYLCFVRGCL